jgi:hypothetical protein
MVDKVHFFAIPLADTVRECLAYTGEGRRKRKK